MARLCSNSKNRENPFNKQQKNCFLFKHLCETMNNKQTMFSFLAKRRRKEYREGKYDNECVVRVTLMSLKSGTLNFCNV